MVKTFVVSLKNETLRRKHISEQCKKYGLNAEIVDAVDMRGIKEDELKKIISLPTHKPKKKWRYLMAGEVGCALSHRKIYEIISADGGGSNYFLVLEDDAEFIKDPSDIIDENTLNLIYDKTSFDIIIIGYVKKLSSELNDYYIQKPIKNTFKYNGITFGNPWKHHSCGTVAYVITRKGAQKMLKATDKICVPADDWRTFSNLYGLKVIHCQPSFVIETYKGGIVSTIGGGRKPEKFSKFYVARKNLAGRLKYFIMNVLMLR